MPLMSRRDAFRAGGVLATAPVTAHLHLLSSKPASSLFAASPQLLASAASASGVSVPIEKPVPYSFDLDAYTRLGLNGVIQASVNKTRTPEDVLSAVRVIRPALQHIKKSTLEAEFQGRIASLTPATMAQSGTPSSYLSAFLQQVAPSAKISDLVARPTLSEAELTESLARIKANGLGGTLQSIVDVMEMQARIPSLVGASYSYHEHLGHAHQSRPHLQRACFFCNKQQFCSSFAAAIADTGALELIVGLVCALGAIASGGATAAFCALVWGTGVPAAVVLAAAMVLYQAVCQDNGLGLTPSTT